MQAAYETFKGEGLKTVAETALHGLGQVRLGRALLENYASGWQGRIKDPALEVEIAGITFENPVIVGAGWDKKGWTVPGLYALGFAGVEVGTVLPIEQHGNEKPRLWTIDKHHSVGLNRMGFNSPGTEVVGDYLEMSQPLPCPIGLNVGRNKITPNEAAAEDHAKVIRRLGAHASYIVLGISSPNTEGLRGLQDKGPLRELIQSAYEAMPVHRPLFVKIDSERSAHELSDMVEVGLEENLTGFVVGNTYRGSDLKAIYGPRWAHETGGLSGADPAYRALTTATIRYIYEEAGEKLIIMGSGGVSDNETALEKIMAGASLVQVVTAMRPSHGKVAAQVNRDLLQEMRAEGVNIQDLVGIQTKRGIQR